MKRTAGLAAALVAVVALGAAHASASNAPIVIPYEKECDAANHCLGTAVFGEDDGTIEMQVDPASFQPTGKGARLSLTEWITVGDVSFTAVMNGHLTPAGFIVLNGTVTAGSFEGAQIHQRSNLVGIAGDKTVWTGELQVIPASA